MDEANEANGEPAPPPPANPAPATHSLPSRILPDPPPPLHLHKSPPHSPHTIPPLPDTSSPSGNGQICTPFSELRSPNPGDEDGGEEENEGASLLPILRISAASDEDGARMCSCRSSSGGRHDQPARTTLKMTTTFSTSADTAMLTGADPTDVKARLKAWAHAVALTSTTQLGP